MGGGVIYLRVCFVGFDKWICWLGKFFVTCGKGSEGRGGRGFGLVWVGAGGRMVMLVVAVFGTDGIGWVRIR